MGEDTAVYEFGPFRLDIGKRLLIRDDQSVPLTPKAFDTLVIFVRNGGRVLNKAELIAALWPDSFVEEVNLNVHISVLRRVLGEKPNDHRYIVTVPRRGFTFVADIREVSDGGRAEKALANPDGAQTATDRAVMADAGDSLASRPVLSESTARLAGRRSKRIAVGALFLAACAVVACVYFFLPGRRVLRPEDLKGKTLAVMPFKVVNTEPDTYLEYGIADAVITRLSSLREIAVLPTNSIWAYSGKEFDPVQAGRALGVDALMMGTLQREDKRIRISLQLVDARNGKTIWAERFDEQMTSLLSVQDSVAAQVAESLAMQIDAKTRPAQRKHVAANPEAYEAYLRGLYHWNKRPGESVAKSIASFQDAIEKDPNYAQAYAGLANSLFQFGIDSASLDERQAFFQKAQAAASEAIKLDETVAEAHTALALLKSVEHDLTSAEKEHLRALELDPNSSIAHLRYGWFLLRRGGMEMASREMRRASELDPLSVSCNGDLAEILYLKGDYDGAIGQSKKGLELDPGYRPARLVLGLAYEQKGLYSEAIAEITRVQEGGETPYYSASLGHVYARAGRKAEAQKLLSCLVEGAKEAGFILCHVALVYSGLGEDDLAFESLEKAIRERQPLGYSLKFDPRLEHLRSNPRFEHLLSLRN